MGCDKIGEDVGREGGGEGQLLTSKPSDVGT